MERNQSFIYRSRYWRNIAMFLVLGYHASGFAETANPADFKKAAEDINALAADVFDNALHLQQSINDFKNKRAIDDQATELVVYVSIKAPDEISLRKLSVELKLNGNILISNEYNAAEIAALASGTSHRLYLGNVAHGSHDLVVQIKEEGGKTYANNHGAIRFEKKATRKTLELSVQLSEKDTPPEVIFMEHS